MPSGLQNDCLISASDEELESSFQFYLRQVPSDETSALMHIEEFLRRHPSDPEYLDKAGEFLFNCQYLRIEDPNCCDRLVDLKTEALGLLQQSHFLAPNKGSMKYYLLGQLTSGQESLDFYLKGIELLKQELAAAESSGVSDVELSEIKNRLADFLVCESELYMTDLCDEDEAETRCADALTEALSISSDHFCASRGMAVYKKVIGDLDSSKTYVNNCIRILHDIEEHNSSITEFGTDKDLPPFDSRASLASVCVDLLMLDEALEICDILIEESEDNPSILFLMASCHYFKGELEDAEELLSHIKNNLDKNNEDVKMNDEENDEGEEEEEDDFDDLKTSVNNLLKVVKDAIQNKKINKNENGEDLRETADEEEEMDAVDEEEDPESVCS